MQRKVHSFSTSSEADAEFVESLKVKSRSKGVNFSWLVIQALKDYQKKKEVADGSTRRED